MNVPSAKPELLAKSTEVRKIAVPKQRAGLFHEVMRQHCPVSSINASQRREEQASDRKPDAKRNALQKMQSSSREHDSTLAFAPPPQVLSPPPSSAVAASVLPADADMRMQMALLAQRVLHELRTSHDGKRVHMRVDLGSGREMAVRLHHEDGRVAIQIDGSALAPEVLARFGAFLQSKGFSAEQLELA